MLRRPFLDWLRCDRFVQGTTVKLGGRLSFPMTLDMKPFTRLAAQRSRPATRRRRTSQSATDTGDDSLCDADGDDHDVYDLTGVVVHAGTATSGHYWTLIRNPQTGRWIECNDTNVIEFDAKRLQDVRVSALCVCLFVCLCLCLCVCVCSVCVCCYHDASLPRLFIIVG